MEYEAHRLEARQDRLHGQLKNETRLLNEVAGVAAEGARDARHAYNAASRYGYGSPYNRMSYGSVGDPILGQPLMTAHPQFMYNTPLISATPFSLGAGISPHLDPAYSTGYLQARREMAIAEQRRRRMLQQRQMIAVGAPF